jgi:predicted TIM-barrel fold metal-dependent hydrolase
VNGSLLFRYLEPILAELPGLRVFDAHTHTGANDPDGSSCTVDQLLAMLEPLDARAVVFTTQEPDGYPEANDRVIAEAAASGGRLVPFCRLDPAVDPVAEAERCIALGARGIKLHPRAEAFGLDSPAMRDIMELANERGLPVLVHAGRGIPALGAHALALADEFPDARIILAHAVACDLAWIWADLPDHPNVFVDTSWWSVADLLALMTLVPPGQILFASDAPYGSPVLNANLALRCALHAGLTAEQIKAIAGGQLERLLAGEPPLDLGPAVGSPEVSSDLLLERVSVYLAFALGRLIAGVPADEAISLARQATEVGDAAPNAATCRAIATLLDAHEQLLATQDPAALENPTARRPVLLGPVLLASTLARTPGVPLPAELVTS